MAPAVVPLTLHGSGGDGLQVTLDLAPLVDLIGARLEALLARKFAELAPQTTHEEALDVPSAAARLGVSEAGVWRLIRTGELDSLKVGARRVVPSSAIDAFLQRR
jgi:excisionase family DNA binding protein